MKLVTVAVLLALAFLNRGLGQNLAPNPSFEVGTTNPESWQLNAGVGTWETTGRSGARSVSVDAVPNSYRRWFTSCPVEQGKAYVVRFWMNVSNFLSGYCVVGFDTASHDIFWLANGWQDYSYVAWIPSNGLPQFRLSSWSGPGKVFFDDVEVLPLNPVHEKVGPYTLGVGESINAGRYVFQSKYDSYSANYSRPLLQANTTFNTFRWYMYSNSFVVYRHHLPGQSFSNAQVSCQILNHYNSTSPTVLIDASTNGQSWQSLGHLQYASAITLQIPTNLLPANEVYIRLRSTNSTLFSLSSYSFAADIPDTVTTGVGATHSFGEYLTESTIRIESVRDTSLGKVVMLSIPNMELEAETFEVSALTEFSTQQRERKLTTVVQSGETNFVEILLPKAGFGDNTASITVRNDSGAIVFRNGAFRLPVSILDDDSYGEVLPAPTNCPVWWCEGTYKVGRERYLPLATNVAVQIEAARNEYEPFQLVLRPETALSNVTVAIGDFIWLTNSSTIISSTNVTICRVEYVPVTQLDEAFASTVGDHPDPLPPLDAPFDAPAKTNSPLWFTVRIPKDAPSGVYEATIQIGTSEGSFTVPVRLRVFDFALTDVTHTRTAYGLNLREDWHGLSGATLEQKKAVWELYLRNFAEHRLSPYYPQLFDGIQWIYNASDGTFTHNYDAFDTAMTRYLEEYHFNSFKDVTGQIGFPSIAGVPTFNTNNTGMNPEYRKLYKRLLQPAAQHIRERGWMDMAYNFWVDEAQPSQAPKVRDGMFLVEEAAPDLSRLLTELAGPNAVMGANLWVPAVFGMDEPAIQARRAAGDEIWFYVCTGPKAPAPNNFIDHPAANPRIRSWYAEMMNMQGELYFSANVGVGITNPWFVTMSSSTYEGKTYLWGNGDGSLIYPPQKNYPSTPLIAGPVDSLRWEMLREGQEDREYFWLLSRVLAIMEPALGESHPDVIEAKAARNAAYDLLPFPYRYPYEPNKMYSVRRRIAEAIEALDDGVPFIAKEPLSKVVASGASEVLRIEAVGWPVPSIQWQHQGTNIPGETGPKLELTGVTPQMAGEYRVIADNYYGSTTSQVGRLTVLVTNQPPVVIKDPASVTHTNFGGRVVFGAGVSSLTPLSYQWFWEGSQIPGATNVTLVVSNIGASNIGQYILMASNSFGVAYSSGAQLSVGNPVAPTISTQPTNQTVAAGQVAQFAVTATGTAPLGYRWLFDGTNLLTGGASNVLTLSNVQPAHAGSYRAVVTNSLGSVTSAVAQLTVQAVPPSIVGQPANQSVAEGQTAQFSVVAGGTEPFGYQWFFNETNALAGANGGILVLTNVQPEHAGNYTVLVSNWVGAVTSAPAVLDLSSMPVYTDEPPTLGGLAQGTDFVLLLAPDNRTRTVLFSSNLVDWTEFYTASPSATQQHVPVPLSNSPSFFRVFVVP